MAWNQWAGNAKILKEPFCIGQGHAGFLKSVDMIWPEILSRLKNASANQQRQLFLGGHSLGAGMSQVVAAKLEFEQEEYRFAAAYHFGCPRALDTGAAARFNERLGSRTYRVVNASDIICDVPPKEIGYSHVGQLKYLSSDGKLLHNPSSRTLRLDGFRGGIRGLSELNPVVAFTDHLPDRYTQKLVALNQG